MDSNAFLFVAEVTFHWTPVLRHLSLYLCFVFCVSPLLSSPTNSHIVLVPSGAPFSLVQVSPFHA